MTYLRALSRMSRRSRKEPADAGGVPRASTASRAGRRPVMLVIENAVPRPDRHAGGVTMSRYLSMFAGAGWHVVFGAANGRTEGVAAEALERQGIAPIRAPVTVEQWLSVHGREVDEVFMARPKAATTLIGAVRRYTGAQVAYYTHDLHHLRLEREAELRDDDALRSEAGRVRAMECAVFASVDHVTTPSEDEARIVRALMPGKPVTALPPYFYDDAEIRSHAAAHFAARDKVLFVGGFPHAPNVDAALFIANEVMPLVWRQRPATKLVLVGYAPPPEVLALASARVEVTGQVPSVEPYLDRARLVLAALRYGAGVKGKTVDALRLGVPVVSTPIGAEGIGIEPGREAMLAEDASGLADAVLTLLGDPDRCAALSAAGAVLVRRQFSRGRARAAIGEVFRTSAAAQQAVATLLGPDVQ